MHQFGDRYHFLRNRFLGLYRKQGDAQVAEPWRIAAEPLRISKSIYKTIEQLGECLLKFNTAANRLYFGSVHKQLPAYIQEYLELGKPEHIIKLMRQNRFKNQLPNIIRPDILVTDEGLSITELDSVPGGMGFVAAMSKAYSELGAQIIGGPDGMIKGFSQIFQSLAESPEEQIPKVAVIVSDEAASYRAEMEVLCQFIRDHKMLDISVCHPRDYHLYGDKSFINIDGTMIEINCIYRFFELFDLPNIPKHELMLYGARHKQVSMTPPPKANIEEKMLLSFLWNPGLEEYWINELGQECYSFLKECVAPTWILDPRPVPPHASITNLDINGMPTRDWQEIAQRNSFHQFVIKPSGFSELAWGSRGVHIGKSQSHNKWDEFLTGALNSFEHTPYVLQRYQNSKSVCIDYFQSDTGLVKTLTGRVRLCPYFFCNKVSVHLGGILATITPMDSYLIHGTSTSVLTVCQSDELGGL